MPWQGKKFDLSRLDAAPEPVDIHRDATRHLALGHGVHYYMGASLAKLEARIAWEELLRRIPEYEVVERPRHSVLSTFYGWEALWIGYSTT